MLSFYNLQSKTNRIIAKRGDILFEKEVFNLSQEKTDYSIEPYPDVLLIEANTKQLLKFLKTDNFNEIVSKANIIEVLSKVNLFKNIPRKKLRIISSQIKIEKYQNDNPIIKEGDIGDKFFIVKSGAVNITVNGNYTV